MEIQKRMRKKKARAGDVLTIKDADGVETTIEILKTTDGRVTIGVVAPGKTISLDEISRDVARVKVAVDNARK